MKKIFCTLALVVAGFATPALAQTPSAVDQVHNAADIFLGKPGDPVEYLSGYVKSVLSGIAGMWTPLPGDMAASPDLPDLMVKACGFIHVTIAPMSEFAFSMTREGKTPVNWTYVALGGNLFSQQVDQKQLFSWLGLDDDLLKDEMRLQALRTNSGVTTIYRPSPDVLVFQTNYQIPHIYARCP